MGGDREDALAVIDDDAAFDKWLVEFDQQRKRDMAEAERERRKRRPTRMSQEQVVKKFAKVHGGEE